jgi:ribosomal protein L9
VLAKLAEAGVVLPKTQLAMHEPFKSLGEHEAALHLHPEVRGKLKVKVVAEKLAEAPAE